MPMDKEVKGLLLGALTGRVRVNEEERTLFDALSRCSASLAKICAGEADCLELPVF